MMQLRWDWNSLDETRLAALRAGATTCDWGPVLMLLKHRVSHVFLLPLNQSWILEQPHVVVEVFRVTLLLNCFHRLGHLGFLN